jgi:putative DNA primase/helicase
MSQLTPDVMKVAVGKWPSILLTLGFTELAVSGKHGPCPMCQGKDRFRMIDFEGSCKWICNQCGQGDGMNLVMAAFNLSFQEAADKVRPLVPGASYAVAPKKPDTAAIKRLITQLMESWRAAGDKDALVRYLEARGLPRKSFGNADLRVGKVDYYDEDGKKKENTDCMLARVTTPQNKTVALHRTYFLSDGRKKKLSKTASTISGGAIRLFSVKDKDTLIIAEGIETALAARHLMNESWGTDHPAWATISANGMKKIAIPKTIKHVIIMGDNDSSFTGQAAAYELANRLTVRCDKTVQVFIPKKVDSDWLDYLILQNQKAARNG